MAEDPRHGPLEVSPNLDRPLSERLGEADELRLPRPKGRMERAWIIVMTLGLTMVAAAAGGALVGMIR